MFGGGGETKITPYEPPAKTGAEEALANTLIPFLHQGGVSPQVKGLYGQMEDVARQKGTSNLYDTLNELQRRMKGSPYLVENLQKGLSFAIPRGVSAEYITLVKHLRDLATKTVQTQAMKTPESQVSQSGGQNPYLQMASDVMGAAGGFTAGGGFSKGGANINKPM